MTASSRTYVRLEGFGGCHVVPVEVLGRAGKRTRIKFLVACARGAAGSVHLVAPAAVFTSATPVTETHDVPAKGG